MHAIADETLIGTWSRPVSRDQLPSLRGVRTASGRLPAPALPTGAMRVQRRVSDSGRRRNPGIISKFRVVSKREDSQKASTIS